MNETIRIYKFANLPNYRPAKTCGKCAKWHDCDSIIFSYTCDDFEKKADVYYCDDVEAEDE